ncbi:hypothetical protein U1Q18_024634 [Sarracenia purpurea var. burkii]
MFRLCDGVRCLSNQLFSQHPFLEKKSKKQGLLLGPSPSTNEAPKEHDLAVAEKSGELEKKEKLPVVACKVLVGSSDDVCRSELRRKQRLDVFGLFLLLATPLVLTSSLTLDLPF